MTHLGFALCYVALFAGICPGNGLSRTRDVCCPLIFAAGVVLIYA